MWFSYTNLYFFNLLANESTALKSFLLGFDLFMEYLFCVFVLGPHPVALRDYFGSVFRSHSSGLSGPYQVPTGSSPGQPLQGKHSTLCTISLAPFMKYLKSSPHLLLTILSFAALFNSSRLPW